MSLDSVDSSSNLGPAMFRSEFVPDGFLSHLRVTLSGIPFLPALPFIFTWATPTLLYRFSLGVPHDYLSPAVPICLVSPLQLPEHNHTLWDKSLLLCILLLIIQKGPGWKWYCLWPNPLHNPTLCHVAGIQQMSDEHISLHKINQGVRTSPKV